MTHPPVSRLDRLLHGLLWALAIVLIPLALVVGVGRELLPLVSGQKPAIERLLTERTGLQIRLGSVRGEWQGLTPQLKAEQVAIHDAGRPDRPLLVVPSVVTRPDWWATLRDLSPRLETTILGLKLTLAPRAGGGIEVVELSGLRKSDPESAQQALRWLLAQPGMNLIDSQLRWQASDSPVQQVRDLRLQQFNGRGDYRLAADFRLEGSDEAQHALLVVDGDPLAWRETPWQAYLDVRDLPSWQPWLTLLPDDWRAAHLASGQARLWLSSQGGMPSAATLALDQVSLRLTVPGRGQREVSGLRGTVSLRGHADAWQLGADDLEGELNNQPLPLHRLAADYRDGRLEAVAARVSLEGLRDVLARERLLPGRWLAQLAEQQPAGWLPRARLVADHDVDGWHLRSANAEFKALTVRPTSTLPGVTGLAGWVQGSAEGGLVYLDARHAELNLHTLFREPVPLALLRGGVRWLRRDGVWHVDTDVLQLANADAEGRIQMTVRVPEHRPRDTRLELLAGLRQANVGSAWRYVPWHSAGDQTLAWLKQALPEGQVTSGAFAYSGKLHPGHPAEGQLDMRLQIRNATLDYQPGWPPLRQMNGEVRLHGRELKVLASDLRVMDGSASSLEAVIPDLRHAALTVKGDLALDLADLDKLLAESPLRQRTARVADMLTLQGPARARLALKIPLGHKVRGETEVRVDAEVENGNIGLPAQKLAFSGVAGKLRFDSHDGLSGSLQSQLWGRAAAVSLDGQARGRQWWRQRIQVDSSIDATTLGRWAGTDLSPYLRGSSPVQVSLDLPVSAPGQTDLRVSASLEGMALLLPEPFAKPASTARPFIYQGKLGDGEHLARASLGQDVQAGLGWRDGALQRLLLRVGLPGVAWPDQPGLYVEARLPELDLGDWQTLLAVQARSGGGATRSAAGGLPGLRQLSLQTDRLVLGEQSFGATRARIQKDADTWRIRLSGLQPKSMPGWPVTDVTAQLTRQGDLWQADPLEVRQPAAAFTGSLSWQAGSRAQTSLKGAIEARDLARLLDQAGQQAFITSEQATAKGSLHWPGDPGDFAVDRLQGSIEMRLKNGRLVEAGKINLLTRVFGLLNASNILRRLRFDFTDITRKGLNYDQISVQGELREGVMKPAKFELDGPTVSIQGRGWANLNTHEIDQQLRVGVPVSSAVPVVAGFLAGPVVGGALVAADLLLDKPLSRLTSVRYHVSGPWDALKVDDEVLEVPDDKPRAGADKEAP